MEVLKILHIICAVSTGLLFFIRGLWMVQNSAFLHRKVIKILPHCIDTLLLATALAMLVIYHLNPLEHSWLLAKIVALPVYIAFGMLAFRFSKQMHYKVIFWLLALCTLGFIYYMALVKSIPSIWKIGLPL